MFNTYTRKNSDGLELKKSKCKTSFKHEIKKKDKILWSRLNYTN